MNSDFRDLLKSLNDEKAEYLIVGGYAVGKHSEPRYTKDLDIWIRSSSENAARVFRALANFGAPLDEITASDFEDPESIYQIGVEPTRIDILAGIEGFDFDDCWKRRIASEFENVKTDFISIEDLIKTKLNFARPQDLIDAKNLEKKLDLESIINEPIDRKHG